MAMAVMSTSSVVLVLLMYHAPLSFKPMPNGGSISPVPPGVM